MEGNGIVRNTATGRYRGTARELDVAARHLRQTMTPAEKVLWHGLRRDQLDGLGFRRQHPVGPIIRDFYCAAHELVVEVDGGVHEEQLEQDAYRPQHLTAFGYRVLRVRNEDVLTDLPSVLARIAAAADAVDGRKSPSPWCGGGVGEGGKTPDATGATPP